MAKTKIKLEYNMHDLMLPHVHGYHDKELLVAHETVSPDIVGMADIKNNAKYLARIDYGLYSCIDREGNQAAALNLGRAIFWTQQGENERGIGTELVSPIPTLVQNRTITIKEAEALWKARKLQLDALAQLWAALSVAHDIPLVYSKNMRPGCTTHWNVTMAHKQPGGHTDCWPIQEGGYFPINYVIYKARQIKKAGISF